jgi:hypothetical protein
VWIANNQQIIFANIHQDFMASMHSDFFKERWVEAYSIGLIILGTRLSLQNEE